MRKTCLMIVLGMLILHPALATERATYLNIGYLEPSATDGGLLFGVNTVKDIDERVELGLSLDYFGKTRTDDETVRYRDPNTNTIGERVVTNFESRVHMIPALMNIGIRFFNDTPFVPMIHAGVGYSLLWNSYDNYDTGEGETNFYHGFAWRAGAGMLYLIGSESALSLEVFYFGAKPSRKEDDSASGLPVRTRLDMSGIVVRVGFRIGNISLF